MGLDNGIVLELPKDKEIPKWAPRCEYRPEEMDDICYWRKCWGLRGSIIHTLDPEGKLKDEYSYPIEAEDIPAIMRCIISFLDKSTWEEEGNSIWEYEEIKTTLINQLLRLPFLKQYLEENPDAKCHFYDSY